MLVLPPVEGETAVSSRFLVLLLFCGCRPATPSPSHRGFYAWKTEWQPEAAERQALTSHRIDRLYLRVFDLGWTANGVRALGQLRLPPGGVALEPSIRLVPVVFIENEVLVRTRESPAEMAARLVEATETALRSAGFDELQLDCDWTTSTKARYFELVDAVRERLHSQQRTLSVTIRLHQVKFRERTGVPAADRGMLMLYNLEPVSEARRKPFIFAPEVADRYVARLGEYPLPLDLALPIFGAVAVFRGGRPLTLLPLKAAAHLCWLDAGE